MPVVWNSSNTTGTVTVQRPYDGNSVMATGPSGSPMMTFSPAGTYTLNLYDGTTFLNSGTFTASCVAGDSWQGGSCQPIASGSCPATTIENCSLPTTAAGGSSPGSCVNGTSGSCNYVCAADGTWSSAYPSVNSCAVAASCGGSPATAGPIPVTGVYTVDSDPTNRPQAGHVWGSGPYTSDSNIAAAAVHAGLVSVGQTATINVTPIGCVNSFTGSTQHGVTTVAYGSPWYAETLSLVGAPSPTATLHVSTNSTDTGLTSVTVNTGSPVWFFWNSSNATSCTAAGGFATGNATSGSVSVTPSSGGTYQVTCSNASGTVSAPASANVTLSGGAPNISISAVANRVHVGESSTVSWSATGVTSCTVSGPGLSSTAKTGSKAIAITAQSVYTITCDGITKTATVSIVPGFKEF